MLTTMASHHFLLHLLLLLILTTLSSRAFPFHFTIRGSVMYPFNCSTQFRTCNASLYHANNGFTVEQVAGFYSVNISQISPIRHANQEDFLITIPCTCSSMHGITGYFYDTNHTVKHNETFLDVSARFFSGQAWNFSEELPTFKPGVNFTMHLLCGCSESDSQIVVTYTVQEHDTLSDIANLLSAKFSDLLKLNGNLAGNPGYIEPGWVLYVPSEKDGVQSSNKGKKHKWEIILGTLSSITVLSTGSLIVVLLRRKRSQQKKEEDPKALSRVLSANKSYSLNRNFVCKENVEDHVTAFESEKPVVFSLEEISEATSDFDDSKKIGDGGYGSVYHGLLGEQEVAIKKMWSNKSKEFFAELKVLCKIHHINVVELLGYACGDDHLFLVYEYIQNGSLSDHLHDPLLQGRQPLSWTARTQIALGAAKGIEYIHDHTKARYVHRDIKTSNILLDERLKAKVADFGLAKLVGRANEDDPIATRLVGTPGYLPPESVKELQVTPKTDVFAFGVVLAELVTGKRALIRDNREPKKMKSLITIIKSIFQDEDPQSALEAEIDGHLRGSYPVEDVFKMAEIAESCLSEDAVDRPEMTDVVVMLSQVAVSSVEWEASLGGSSQVFSGVFKGR